MKMKSILVVFLSVAASASAVCLAQDVSSDRLSQPHSKELREVLRLQDHGMHNHASHRLNSVYEKYADSDPRGYAIMSDIISNRTDYKTSMDEYLQDNPHTVLAGQMLYRHALNLFDVQDYKSAGEMLDSVAASQIRRSQLDEYLFKKAYCELEAGDVDRALLRFLELEKRPVSDYTAPAKYSIGYINYDRGNYHEALEWFEQSASDSRFSEISDYYIMECRFMLKDYAYITKYGEKVYARLSDERKPYLARIISESWLVKGDAEKARKYYDLSINAGAEPQTRSDWFYSGSVLYAVKDYKGAIKSFTNMGSLTDSIGQVANYHLGYSYIQTKNKVAALEAFKGASAQIYDPVIAEDAYFNWAKLAFDINNDPSVFQNYMKRYSDKEKDDKIYSYIAVAALHNRDYASAVDAYGMIDELDEDMTNNYMKANYLRANQLISSGSYRLAIPCLKVSAYYSEKSSRFNQLTRFWMAESYYRDDKFKQARELFVELYNQSALNRQPESYLIPYNIAYCYYKEGDYPSAMKWFSTYLAENQTDFRKDALERYGDCCFIQKKYKDAVISYDKVLKDYFNVNDIYPYYQSAISYGLSGNNARKISLLSNVLEADPESRFYPEALFELGRAYISDENDEKAFDCFRTLADKSKDSTYVARAYIEMGSISRNQSQFNEALGYYKEVVESMPLSEYADDALAAIESIYQTKNEPQTYLAYIETIGKGETKTEDEREDMIFNSAEQVYMTGNYQKALSSLESYLEKYPEGKYVSKSNYYMAESYRTLGKYEQACDFYEAVIDQEPNPYVELSMLHFSNICYDLEKWDMAYGGYSSLRSAAKIENNRLTATKGMMRAAFRWHNWNATIKAADDVLYEPLFDADVKREASYMKSKALMASSRRAEALAIMENLASDVNDAYGAEAAYTLILDSYDKGNFTDVEDKVYAFSDSGSPQTYWLAKSFIILGDSFVDRDRLNQAKATFESVRDGYKPSSADDDVIGNVRMRLEKLDEIIAQSN